MTAKFFDWRKNSGKKYEQGFGKKAKRFFCGALTALATVFVAGAFLFARQTKNAEEIVLNKRFYFLVSAGENVQSCLAEAYLAGGAGIEMQTSSRAYAVYACYTGENGKSLAEAAQAAIGGRGENVKTGIIPQTRRALYLKTSAQKRRKNEISGVLHTLDECADVLYLSAVEAERGEAGQAALKETAKCAAMALSYLSKHAGNADKAAKRCAAACGRVSEELKEMAAGIVYARDLRRAQIEICLSYLDFSDAYSI